MTAPAGSPEVLLETGLHFSSFAESNAGELYLIHYNGGDIYRLIAE